MNTKEIEARDLAFQDAKRMAQENRRTFLYDHAAEDRALLLAEVKRLRELCGRASFNLPIYPDSALFAELRDAANE